MEGYIKRPQLTFFKIIINNIQNVQHCLQNLVKNSKEKK